MVKLNNSETDGFNRIPMSDVAQVVTQDVVTDGGKRFPLPKFDSVLHSIFSIKHCILLNSNFSFLSAS